MTLPTAPSRTMSQDTFDSTTDAFIGALPQFEADMNALAAAMALNSTTDTSASSVAIGTGAKTFTVSASKSFWPGMWLVIADTAAPTTNAMFCQVTSYSGTTLIVNSYAVLGSGTKTAWQISQSAPAALGGLYVATTGNESIAGVKTFSDTTESTSSTTGGTKVSGGLGVAKSIFAGTAVVAPAMRGNKGSTSALNNTFTTLFTATTGMYLVYMQVTDAGVLYLAEGIAVFDTAAGTMLQTANGANAALQVSGMDIQGKQVSGGTANIAWAFLKVA